MKRLLIKNAHIMTMAEQDYENGFVVILDDKIVEVGGMNEAPETDSEYEEIIDAKGRLLFPGIIDAHCHVGMWEDSLGFEGADGNEETDPITPQLRAIDAINPFDRCISDARRAGITTLVTGPGSANVIGGQFAAIKTAGHCIDDMIVKAPVAMKFALGENPKTVYHDKKRAPMTRMATAATLREFLFKSKQYGEQKKKHAENPEKYKKPDFSFKYEAMEDVMSGKLPVKIHAHRADDICTAIRIGREFSLDFTIEHATEGHLICDILKENHVDVMLGPTMSERSKPELRNMSYDTYKILDEAGLSVAIITDHPVIPIEYLPVCAALAVKNGFSHESALRALTINAAKNCRIDQFVGSIEVGKDADMSLFSGDVLDVYAKPDIVLVSGEVFHY